MLVFGYAKKEAITNNIIIKEDNDYTEAFRRLLKYYYLQF
jgi:hypothetical protein